VTATVSTGGTFVGTTTAAASLGVATFTSLGVNGNIGTSYTITYTASGLTIATTTVLLSGTTCDGSFTCQIGDTGPGGGIVFYVSASSFTQTGATGAMCNSNCKYLEVSPTVGTNNWNAAGTYVWSGNTNTAIGETARGTDIGTGYANTLAIVQQSSTASRAGTISREYGGPNNLSDWYLPSKVELNQMCKWQRGIIGTDLTTLTKLCSSGTTNSGQGAAGFSSSFYWSSSEDDATFTWSQYFFSTSNGGQGSNTKENKLYVRPIRAF
jgi:hypothetical protein